MTNRLHGISGVDQMNGLTVKSVGHDVCTHDRVTLTADWNFHSLQISHGGDLDCSAAFKSFCSWVCFVYYHSRSGKVDKHIDDEICEMNEEHKHDDNSSNVPQDGSYLTALCIHWNIMHTLCIRVTL